MSRACESLPYAARSRHACGEYTLFSHDNLQEQIVGLVLPLNTPFQTAFDGYYTYIPPLRWETAA